MANTKIYRTFTAGNTDRWTYSAWIKRSNIGATSSLFAGHVDGSNRTDIKFNGSDQLVFEHVVGNSYVSRHISNRLFKDCSAWYHIVVVWDTPNADEHERQRLYINGVEENNWGTATNCAQNTDSWMNNTASTSICNIGIADGGNYFDGLMSHVQFVDGLALAPTEFGEVDATSGVWKIKTGSYATPGTNGFHLKMEDSTNMDLDSSSNTLTFTTSGTLLSALDNPGNNFATCDRHNISGNITMTNGNTSLTTSSNGWYGTAASLGFMKGFPCYFETKITAGLKAFVGLSRINVYGLLDTNLMSNETEGTSKFDYMVRVTADNTVWKGGSNLSGTFASVSAGDIVSMTASAAGEVKIYKNDTLQYTWAAAMEDNQFYFPIFAVNGAAGAQGQNINLGNGYFGTTAVASANADGNGVGAFEYAPPSGFYALCTKNLATLS